MRRTGAAALKAMAGLCALAGPAHAVDKFKVTSVDCEMFYLWRYEPILHYDIVDERRADYQTNPAAEHFASAAERTAAYCDRTSDARQQPLGPPRKIRGVWFQSNDDQVKILYSFDQNGVDLSAGLVNRIGDRYAADRRAAAQQAAQLEQIRTREAREQELNVARAKAEQDRAAAQARAEQDRAAAQATREQARVATENAREQAFYGDPGLQVARLGTKVTHENFAFVQDVRVNPFHYKKLGVAVVRTAFNKMVSDHLAMFGNELAPIFVHLDDVDRFTRSGETVMLAFRPVERGEVERSYGSVPELILSAIKQEPLWGDYVGAYTCPGDDCGHVFDVPPPT